MPGLLSAPSNEQRKYLFMSAEIAPAAPKKKMWISNIKKNAPADLKAADEASPALTPVGQNRFNMSASWY